jgi:esterase/lipase
LLAPAIEVSKQRSPILPTRAWHEFAKYSLWFTTVTYSPFEGACKAPDSRTYPGRTKATPTTVVDETFQLINQNRGRASELRMPQLMVVTRDDEVVDWQGAERYYAQAKGEPKRICILDNSDHEIPVDYQWKEVSHEIDDFLRGLPQWGNRRRDGGTFTSDSDYSSMPPG